MSIKLIPNLSEFPWLRIHGQAEQTLRAELRNFFSKQAKRVADAVSDFGTVTHAIVPLVFRPIEEAERLQAALHGPLLRVMAFGAANELEAVDIRSGKAVDPMTTLPERTLARIRQHLLELEQQPYWQDIQAETQTRLIEVIQQGIEDAAGNYEIGMRIREHLGGFPANRRAQRIARTEATGAMNAGHESAREELYAEGMATGKSWNAIGDDDVRTAHAYLNGVAVGPREDFDVGGTMAPWPGWWGLPAEQRINCRCTTLTVLNEN